MPALPGIGPILAAGSLGVGLLTGVAGSALSAANTGSLVKALTELGIDEPQARIYSDRLLQGYYLVIVDGTDEEINRAGEIFRQLGQFVVARRRIILSLHPNVIICRAPTVTDAQKFVLR